MSLQSAEEVLVMATRILGPTGSKRRKRFLLGPVLLVAALAALFVAGGARAVHDLGLFELDRNATTQTNNDWDHVFNAPRDTTGKCTDPTTALGANALACSFVHDPTGASIFTGGSSKDDNDINVVSGTTTSPNWLWKDGSVPDKDNLNDAYAALFTNPTSVSCTPPPTPCAPQAGDQILYVGADRFANNGSTDMGFWFFKNPVSVNSSGSFDGVHTVGDLLLLSTFTQGGATTTIRAFVWVGKNGTCPTGTGYATSANTICGPVATLADCTVASAGDFGCATVNGVAANPGTPSPWPYTSKFPDGTQSASNIFASGTFLEGGIDLTEFGLQGCFSTFLAETRSSPSVTATLKDLVVGS